MTDESDRAQADDATAQPDLPAAIAELGIEAQAEFIRARTHLGLASEGMTSLGVVGRYRLETEIGRGGMGIVFRAHDPKVDRPVAIKLVQAVPFTRHAKLRARLLREAKVLGKLNHANVVRIYDCGEHEGEVYLAMELVEGTTLRKWQQGKTRREILGAYAEAARGLAAAHDMGIIHRDFKPDNVLVAGDDRILVGDFGLAGLPAEGDATDGEQPRSAVDPNLSATRTGALVGTLTYMAPEQLRGEGATPHSDQFAFCVALWEALAGARPFAGEHRDVLLEQIEQGAARRSKVLPRRIRARLLRGLAVAPQERFDDLRQLADGLVPNRSWGVLVAALVLSLGLGLVLGEQMAEPGRREPPSPDEREQTCAVGEQYLDLEGMSEWGDVAEKLDTAELRPSYERLRDYLQEIQEETDAHCQATDADLDFDLAMKIKKFRQIIELAPELELSPLLGAISDLEEGRWRAPLPYSLDPEVTEFLRESYSHKLHSEFEDAIGAAEQAIFAADGKDLDLAEAYRWSGRLMSLSGQYSEAIEEYLTAISHAETAAANATYDDARLDIELLIARTEVMRRSRVDRARESLLRVYGLFRRFDEPWISSRRADYHEVLASVLKRQGHFDKAVFHQYLSLIRHYWSGDIIKIGRGYLNLGTIYEHQFLYAPPEVGTESDTALRDQTRAHYERAVAILEPLPSSPEWSQAAFNLAHWLVRSSGQEDWPRAERLLWRVSKSDDLRIATLTELILLADGQHENKPEKAIKPALELRRLLLESSELTPDKEFDAWKAVALAFAMNHDTDDFESARTRFLQVFDAELDHSSSSQVDYLYSQVAALDFVSAQHLESVAPRRARELAESARDYLLRVEESERPAGLFAAIEDFLH